MTVYEKFFFGRMNKSISSQPEGLKTIFPAHVSGKSNRTPGWHALTSFVDVLMIIFRHITPHMQHIILAYVSHYFDYTSLYIALTRQHKKSTKWLI